MEPFSRFSIALESLVTPVDDGKPSRVKNGQGELFVLLTMRKFDEANALWYRRLAIDRPGEMPKEGFETPSRDVSIMGGCWC
jgi:hypothetical protein